MRLRRSTGTSRRQVFDRAAGSTAAGSSERGAYLYNAIDRHVAGGRADQIAVIYDSPVTGRKPRSVMLRCLFEVTRWPQCSGRRRRKGDRVLLYLPWSRSLVGHVRLRPARRHSLGVFGGLRQRAGCRIDDAKPKVILSASCGIEGGSIVSYKPMLDEAIALASATPEACIILQLTNAGEPPWGRDYDWWELRGAAIKAGKSAASCGARHRPALFLTRPAPPPAERRRARQWRPHGGAQLVDEIPVTGCARRGILGGLRRRLGGRPQLHRLRPLLHGARPFCTRASRSARPDAARSGGVISEHECVAMFTAPTALRRSRRKIRTADC